MPKKPRTNLRRKLQNQLHQESKISPERRLARDPFLIANLLNTLKPPQPILPTPISPYAPFQSHNHTKVTITKEQIKVLHLNGNFVPNDQKGPTKKDYEDLTNSIKKFKRQILLKANFASTDPEEKGPSKISVKSTFTPKEEILKHLPLFKKYYDDLETKLTLLCTNPPHLPNKTHDHNTNITKIIKELLEILEKENIMIVHADKGLGLVLVDKDWPNSTDRPATSPLKTRLSAPWNFLHFCFFEFLFL